MSGPLVFAHRGASCGATRAHPRRVPARPRRGRRRAGVRRPADPGRAPGLRPRPATRPHQQRSRTGQRAYPRRAGRPGLRLVASGQHREAERRDASHRTTRTDPAAHPGPAAGRGARRRPAGAAAGRDEAPVPLRLERRTATGRAAATLRAGRPARRTIRVPVTVMSFSPLAVRRVRELAPTPADGAVAGGAAALAASWAGCRSAPASPGRVSVWCGPVAVLSAVRRPATRCTSGPSTTRPTWSWSSPPASRGPSPTGRAGPGEQLRGADRLGADRLGRRPVAA